MNKTTLIFLLYFFLSSCDKTTDKNTNIGVRVDTLNTTSNDSIETPLTPLSWFTESSKDFKKIQDTLLSYSEIKNIINQKSDTFDINLFVVGGHYIGRMEDGQIRSHFPADSVVVSLMTINKFSFNHIIHADFCFDRNTFKFFVADSTGHMTIETWCKKQGE